MAAEAAKRYSPPQLDTMMRYRGALVWLLRCDLPNCAQHMHAGQGCQCGIRCLKL